MQKCTESGRMFAPLYCLITKCNAYLKKILDSTIPTAALPQACEFFTHLLFFKLKDSYFRDEFVTPGPNGLYLAVRPVE